MAVLHRKEEKLQVVLGRLPKKYTHDEFIAMFIKLYSKDWGKIKSAYIKQSQDKEPGTVVRMPKPDLYLKQLLENYLQNRDAKAVPAKEDPVVAEAPQKVKATKTKKEAIEEETPAKAKSATQAKKETIAKESAAPAKKTKASTKETDGELKAPAKPKKATVKKETVAEVEVAPQKAKATKAKKTDL